MFPVVMIAGLNVSAFDELKRLSSNKLAPNGALISMPVRRNGFPSGQAQQYINELFKKLITLPERKQVAITLLYVDYQDSSTEKFVENFFPFALARPISQLVIPDGSPRMERDSAIKRYGNYLVDEALEIRRRASLIREQTSVHNVTPLLLPISNFRSRYFQQMLSTIYSQAGTSESVPDLLREAIDEFKRYHPRTYPPNDNRSCFSDGALYFRSPGKHRHGFYRHSADGGHSPLCLINARSRLGGSYDYTLHYDCTAVHKLGNHYPNCHDMATAPGPRHINISPNDYII